MKKIDAIRQKNLGALPAGQASDFAKIKSWGGDKNSAITNDGLKVERLEYLFVDGYGLVKTCPYELHFVYEDRSKKKGRWTYMCTCGSIAGISSWNEIKSLVTITGHEPGYVLVCIAHTTLKQNIGIGKHADNSSE